MIAKHAKNLQNIVTADASLMFATWKANSIDIINLIEENGYEIPKLKESMEPGR